VFDVDGLGSGVNAGTGVRLRAGGVKGLFGGALDLTEKRFNLDFRFGPITHCCKYQSTLAKKLIHASPF
jgi:hypothetical protein